MGQQEMRENTIVAVSTPSGSGGIAVIRLSGPDSFSILRKAWRGKNPEEAPSHTVHVGWLTDASGEDLDQVVATLFRSPNSYTGEDVVEVSCHGSPWLQRAVVDRLVECGAVPAGAGEFTRRAFLNGRLDLVQAEGVADMIAASSRASARIAASQLKGNFSTRLRELRQQLLDLGVLLELELDFSEEDVEFADRSRLIAVAEEMLREVRKLAASFRAGNAFKNGVPVAIAGIPNAGKSTLLNALLGEEKAIVASVPGTTRDVIEDTVEIGGILFRFSDTAGLRESEDEIERIGVERARGKISTSAILVFMVDPTQDVSRQLSTLASLKRDLNARLVLVASKADMSRYDSDDVTISMSAKEGIGIEELKEKLVAIATEEYQPDANELIVTNARHYEALKQAEKPLERLLEGLENGVSADFLAQDLREAERHLGEITGAVTSTEILHTIFSRYCIGK